MYALNAIVCGCDEELLPHLRRELFRNHVQIEAEFAVARDAARSAGLQAGPQRLLVLEMRSAEDLETLRHLKGRFPQWPLVALLPSRATFEASHELVLRAMRCGAAQVIHLPLEPHDFTEMLEQIAIQYVYATRGARVIAVAGATGGCGGTTLAVNLAFELANLWGLRCILVDLSLRMGMVATYLDLHPQHTILDLLKDPARIDTTLLRAVLQRVGDNLDVLAGPHEAIAQAMISFDDVRPILERARSMADILLLDVHCTYDTVYFETLDYARQVVLLGEQKLSSVRAMILVCQAIARAGSNKELTLVINRYNARLNGFTADCLLKPLGAERLRTIAADESAMLAALNSGSASRLHKSDSPALTDIDALAESLVGSGPPPTAQDASPRGLLHRLSRRRWARSKS